MRKLVAGLLGLLSLHTLLLRTEAHASAYDGKPKLVVVVVLDQFRGDYLDRYRSDYQTPNGFNLFLKKGAYFPDCYYDYANTMTAPGHSTIGTGAYTNGHNIALNEWWDLERSRKAQISSVQDERFPLVGMPGDATGGASPHNQLASTLGDEVVLSTGGRAKLFGVSLKDRAAILTSGHASQGAYWIDHVSGKFITSTYWMPELPAWVTAFNSSGRIEKARVESAIPTGDFYESVGATAAGVKYELDFTKALIKAEDLGRHDVTDVLTLSISSTDILGHRVGPDSPKQRDLLRSVDLGLDDFFTWLSTQVEGGLGNVWVAITGDHGVATSTGAASREGMPAASFSYAKLNAELDRELNARFSTKKSQHFVLGGELPYIQLDRASFEAQKVGEAEAETLVAELLPSALDATQQEQLHALARSRTLQPATIRRVYTRVQVAAGNVPNTEEGRLVLHSYSTNGGWWVMLTPGMYQVSGYREEGATHYTPYAYDRHVPLGFFGAPFVPGTYLQRAAPVDIAATFAALLRVNQPSACVGRVVTEALRPNGEAEVHPKR